MNTHIKNFDEFNELNESNTGQNDYTIGDIVLVRYELLPGDAITTPVKIIKRYTPTTFLASHKVEDSNIKNSSDFVLKLSDIISAYRTLTDPMPDNYITQNPQINPNLNPNLGVGPNKTNLPANQQFSNDIAF
jgi:hypothetical protein